MESDGRVFPHSLIHSFPHSLILSFSHSLIPSLAYKSMEPGAEGKKGRRVEG
jgi:hypothetical protein